tara:strand:+ start:766 stop:1752 length:987 start_codon:yes stop_codon:yes gene_type:complete
MQPSTLYNKILNKIIPPNHWGNIWLKDLCHADTTFLEHLIEQRDDFIHFLCLVYLYKNDSSKYKRLSNNELAILIRTHPKKLILKDLIRPYPPGITNLLKKLNGKPFSKNTYFELIELLHDTKASTHLQHASSINSNTIKCLFQLDHSWRDLKILHNVKTTKDTNIILFIHRACLKLGEKYPDFIDHVSLHKIKDIDGLIDYLIRRINKITFPEPPWVGNKRIRPITNGEQLNSVSKKFKNCIADYICEILMGACYFYVSSYGPSIIKLNRNPIFIWHVEEILGVENDEVTKHALRTIHAEFSEHDIDKKTNIEFDNFLLDRLTSSWV